jgi:hypothetical protein
MSHAVLTREHDISFVTISNRREKKEEKRGISLVI